MRRQAAGPPTPHPPSFTKLPLPPRTPRPAPAPAVGNDTGLSPGEQRAHFALWSLYKSPLMIGHDLRDFSKASLGVLLSKVRDVAGRKC